MLKGSGILIDAMTYVSILVVIFFHYVEIENTLRKKGTETVPLGCYCYK